MKYWKIQEDSELEGLLNVVVLDAPLVDKYARAYLDTLYFRASHVHSFYCVGPIFFKDPNNDFYIFSENIVSGLYINRELE